MIHQNDVNLSTNLAENFLLHLTRVTYCNQTRQNITHIKWLRSIQCTQLWTDETKLVYFFYTQVCGHFIWIPRLTPVTIVPTVSIFSVEISGSDTYLCMLKYKNISERSNCNIHITRATNHQTGFTVRETVR